MSASALARFALKIGFVRDSDFRLTEGSVLALLADQPDSNGAPLLYLAPIDGPLVWRKVPAKALLPRADGTVTVSLGIPPGGRVHLRPGDKLDKVGGGLRLQLFSDLMTSVQCQDDLETAFAAAAPVIARDYPPLSFSLEKGFLLGHARTVG